MPPKNSTIVLLAGSAPNYGTGHQVRMQELYSLLVKKSKSYKNDYQSSRIIPQDKKNNSGSEKIKYFKQDNQLMQVFRAFSKVFQLNKVSYKFYKVSSPKMGLKVLSKSFLGKKYNPQNTSIILDIPFSNPKKFLNYKSVLCLDNHHSSRKLLERSKTNKILYFDSLIYNAKSWKTFKNHVLISKDLQIAFSNYKKLQKESNNTPKNILVYAGNLITKKEIELFVKKIQVEQKNFKIIWIGSSKRFSDLKNSLPKKINIKLSFYKYVSRKKFINFLLKSDVFLSYTGLSFFEAWYCNKELVLLETSSKIHKVLAKLIHKKTKIPILNKECESNLFFDSLYKFRAIGLYEKYKPSGEGYELLTKDLLKFFNQIDKN